MDYKTISVKPETHTKYQAQLIAYQARIGKKADNTDFIEYLLTLDAGKGGKDGKR